MKKEQIKRLAKEYVYELLYKMDTPQWILDKGINSEDLIRFMVELRKIADKVVKS